jgi:hypothetical protein
MNLKGDWSSRCCEYEKCNMKIEEPRLLSPRAQLIERNEKHMFPE